MSRTYLEEFILFSICVANKPAVKTAAKINGLLQEVTGGSPFQKVRLLVEDGMLDTVLRKHRMGQYSRIEQAFREVICLDKINVQTLESIHGIGPKTARLIMLYWKPNSQVVPLDTHVLAFLRELGYDAPKITPTGKRYLTLESAFLAEAAKRKMTVKELDEQVWRSKALKA